MLLRRKFVSSSQLELLWRASVQQYFLSFTPPYGPRLSPAVAYSPNNSVFDEIVNKIARRYDNDTKITYIGVDTAENLENLLMQNSTIIAGIQFNHPDVSYCSRVLFI